MGNRRRNDIIFYCPTKNCGKSYSRLEYVKRHSKVAHKCIPDPSIIRKISRDKLLGAPSSAKLERSSLISEGNSASLSDSVDLNVGSPPIGTPGEQQAEPTESQDSLLCDTTIYDCGNKLDENRGTAIEPRRSDSRLTATLPRMVLPAVQRHSNDSVSSLTTSTSKQDVALRRLQLKIREQEDDIDFLKHELVQLRTSVGSICDAIGKSLCAFSDWSA